MSVQVGSFCYATPAAAGVAACSSFVPVTSVSGTNVVTLSCASSDADGQLHMQSSVSPLDGSTAAVISVVLQPVAYPLCTQSDYVVAAETCVSAALGVWAIWWGGKKVLQMLEWGRGEVL